jgi:hypothetical protein
LGLKGQAVTQSMLVTSPYQRYNLRRNPFGELTRQERAALAVVELNDWLSFLQRERVVLQFIGPCGHGKTTHLLAIQQALGNAEYVYLPEEGPQPRIGNHRPMIVDEAQRLSFWQLRKVLSIGGPIVFGTHKDLSAPIGRARLAVETVDVSGHLSVQRLTQILNCRIESSRLTDGTIPCITEDQAFRLQHQFGANVRAIEHFLYDQFQRSASEKTSWPPAN